MTAVIGQMPFDSDPAPPTGATGPPIQPPGRPSVGTSLRDALLAIGFLLLMLVLVELAVPTTGSAGAAPIVDGIAVASFTVTGLIAWYRRPHNHIGRLMVAMAVALWAAGTSDDAVETLRTLGHTVDPLPLAVLLHLLLAYPSGRLVGRPARITVLAGYLVAVGLQIPQVTTTSDAVVAVIWTVQAGLGLCVMAVVFALASRRLAGAPPTVRRQLAPFIVGGCLAIIVLAGTIGVLHARPDPAVEAVVILIQVITLTALPVAFVIGLLAGAFGRAGELEEVARGLSAASADPALLDALVVRALGDPSAQVYWNTDADRYLDSAGEPLTPTADRGGWWPIEGAGGAGGSIGALAYDQGLIADPGLVAAVSAPLALAISNRKLVVDLRAAVNDLDAAADQIRTSRRRIVVAADAERRRIARDLHDGAQQRIVLIGIEAQRMGRRAEDPVFVRSMTEQVSQQLRLLLDELRALVHGIMPATLEERGLRAGVDALADQMPMPVRVQVVGTLDRMAAEVESTGYFVVAEALANAIKRSVAHSVSITLTAAAGRLEIVVTNDGSPVANIEPGFGLRSLQDRVAALDGTVTLRSAPDRGTSLRAEFACG